MGRRLIDLSIPLDNSGLSDPPGFGPHITYEKHHETVGAMAKYFDGLRPDDLPDGEGWAHERVELSTHNGTHMDAPWHFHSTQDAALPGGPRPSKAIDETPLEWCFQPGVKLDFRHMPDGHVATAGEVEAELRRIGHELRPLDIVVVNTAAGAAFGTEAYVNAGCGMGREATLYLAERGVKIVGTDAWSWDAPFFHTAKKWRANRDPSIIWEGHKAGREIGYWQMEKLANLDQLPAIGFEMICFPVRIKGASAGWVRAIAIVQE